MVRAHLTDNQFNDYLEHATNTEHASLITLPPTNWDRGENARKAVLYRCPPPRSGVVQPNEALWADDGGRGEGEGWRKSGSGARYVMEHASVTQSVSHREACKTWCAHVTENQLNDYLKHATNTEHASLVTLPPTNVHLR